MRGHTDDRSNFCALLDYKSEDLLPEHLETGPENARYVNHRTKNELIRICGQQIVSPIL